MDVYIYINARLSDPLYHAASFWDLSCSYLENVYRSLQNNEKDRIQAESVSTAYLADTVLSVTHALYGKEGEKKYKPDARKFLPFYEPSEDIDAGDVSHNLSPETIAIFIEEYENGSIPQFAVIHLAEFIGVWSESIDS
jgi:hypothetical protein